MKKRPDKKSLWPKITQITNHGNAVFLVDARIKGKGERRFFETKGDADVWARTQRIRRINEGYAGGALPERLRVEARECQRRLKSFGTSLTDAVDYYLRHATPAGGERKISELVVEFIAAKRKAGRREEYLRIQASVLGLFSKKFPEAHAHEINSHDVDDWLTARGGTLRTRSNYQNDVRNLFNFAVKHGYTASNPVDKLEKITLDQHAVEILTIEQVRKLLQAAEDAKGAMTPFIAIGLFAGLRTREIAGLDWKDVSIAEKAITVQDAKTKTRARRIVEMSDNLAAWLLPYSAEFGPVTPEKYRSRFEEIREVAGITPWPRNAMRRSAAGYHIAAHSNEMLTQAMLGHELGKMLIPHYRELVKPKDAARYWKILPPAAMGAGKITTGKQRRKK